MRFEAPLIEARLIRRYKRFLADMALPDGSEVTVHCPNTGAMLGCQTPGAAAWLLPVDKASRKYPLGWELVEALPSVLVGINTGRSNALVAEALARGIVPELAGYSSVRREVRLARGESRMDFLLSDHPAAPDCYLEVKNVTAAVENGCAFFPDAVSTRATRHLGELQSLVERGFRAAMCFCVQRADVTSVRPADEIDPAYGMALRAAVAAGVEVYGLRAEVSRESIRLKTRVPVRLAE
jgi:sugar fermentation stimulation protein A